MLIVIENIPHGSVLDHFNLSYIFLLPRVPNGCWVLKKESYIIMFLKGRFFIFSIMCLNVSFGKCQGVIAFSCELVNVFGP